MLNALVALLLAAPPGACNDRQVWDPNLVSEVKAGVAETMGVLEANGVKLDPKQRKKIEGKLFSKTLWGLVRTLLIGGDNNNVAVLALKGVKTSDGRVVTLFRSGFTPDPTAKGSCFKALVDGGVRHVLNLYGGPMRTADLDAAEKQVVEGAGGTYFLARDAGYELGEWRELLRKKGDVKVPQAAVATLINDHVLRPGGALPKGDIHVHCGGGMHRTGMVVGIIDRCVNGAAADKVLADYRKHVGWRSQAVPGGFEQGNIDFIQGFDCSVLKR
jgi:hypothetical protein